MRPVGQRKVVLASRNRDKVRELQQIFSGTGFEVLCAGDFPGLPDVIEDGTTILGNATRKAMLTAAYTGEIALADDTSLQIRELNGWPDIFAARFSGPGATYASNAELVLELMKDVPPGVRNARFATACVWIDPRPLVEGDASPGDRPVLSPVARRWYHNPWAGTRPWHPGSAPVAPEWEYWSSLVDRREQWRQYATEMLADATSFGGHDRTRLKEIGEGLLAGCPDSPQGLAARDAAKPGGASVRLPDPRIWQCRGPGHDDAQPSPYFPSGLPGDAPGPDQAQPQWLELSAVGQINGEITAEAIGGGGFGYDPVFRPVGVQSTLAEMEPGQKNAISHRGRALRRLLLAIRFAYKV